MRTVCLLPFGLAYAGLILHLAGTPVQTQPDGRACFGDGLTGDNVGMQILKAAPGIQHGLKINRPNSGSNFDIERDFGVEPFHKYLISRRPDQHELQAR